MFHMTDMSHPGRYIMMVAVAGDVAAVVALDAGWTWSGVCSAERGKGRHAQDNWM